MSTRKVPTGSRTRLFVFIIIFVGLLFLAIWWGALHLLNNQEHIDASDPSNEGQKSALAITDSQNNIPTIAVLPFKDFSANSDQAFFGKGLSEELLNILSKYGNLQVISRTSSFSYIDKKVDAKTISSQLNAKYLVEGSVRKSGDNMRVSAQLVDSSKDMQIWSQTYDRTLTKENIFQIQDDITQSIIKSLLGEIDFSAVKPDIRKLSLSSYNLYLEGRDNAYNQEPKSIEIAINNLEQVIANHPEFTPAYAYLTHAYMNKSLLIGSDFMKYATKAGDTFYAAQNLGDPSEELHAIAARYFLQVSYQNQKYADYAEASARAAIEMNPNYMLSYKYLAQILNGKELYQETQFLLEDALKIDPRSPVLLDVLFDSQLEVQDYVSAKETVDSLFDIAPQKAETLENLVAYYGSQNDFIRAHGYAQELYALAPERRQRRNLLYVYESLGLHNIREVYADSAFAKIDVAIDLKKFEKASIMLEEKAVGVEIVEWYFRFEIGQYNKALALNEIELAKEDIWTKPVRRTYAKFLLLWNTYLRQRLNIDYTKQYRRLEQILPTYTNKDELKSEQMNLYAILFVIENDKEGLLELLRVSQARNKTINLENPMFDYYRNLPQFKELLSQDQQEIKRQRQAVLKELRAPKPSWIVPAEVKQIALFDKAS